MNLFLSILNEHWILMPLLIPMLGAFVSPFFGRYRRALQRLVSVLVLVATVAASAYTVAQAAAIEGWYVYQLGSWSPPFGIVLVVDRLSAAFVAMTSILGLCALLYAIWGDDRRDSFFHFLFLVQIAGLNGAFLTGDLFNLFVFFEILLIASYNLLVYGSGSKRVRAGIHYVVINLVGSAFFLMTIGLLYGLTGTLNMADMATQMAALPQSEAALARAGATLLIVVFGVKSALLPLYFWLPRAYSSATAPVAALFAVMTKVGIYAILRTSVILFGEGAGVASDITAGWLIPLSLATLVFGVLGVAAAKRLKVLVAYLVVVSAGTILVPVAIATPDSIAGALYYIVHSTFVTGALFLLADLIADRRGDAEDSLDDGPAIASPAWLSVAFFVAAIVIAGLPPTSGFIGKILILESAFASGWTVWIWAVVLTGSLLTIIALVVAGARIFWHTDKGEAETTLASPQRAIAPLMLLGIVAGWTLLAGPAHSYLTDAAEQLLDRERYVQSIDPQSFDASELQKQYKKQKKKGSDESGHKH